MICPGHDFKYIRRLRPKGSPKGIVVWECALCGVIVPKYPEKLTDEEQTWYLSENQIKQLQKIDCTL